MSCAGKDDDLRAVCLGDDGAFGLLSEGAVFTDYATVSAKVTAEPYAEAANGGVAYARIHRRIGDSGAGQRAKICNRIASAGPVRGLSAALHFAPRAGLDGRAVVEGISQGAAGSWQMPNRSGTMRDDDFDHGFAVDRMRKDLGI